MQDLNITKLDRANTICLLNSLENIEKQARLISCKQLDDEMNKRFLSLLFSAIIALFLFTYHFRYSALLINRRSVQSAQKERERE